MLGQTIGSYEILEKLGEGGMAAVYLARDLRHDRRVALKVMRQELAAAIGVERFLREVKTTAGLQHPHILPLHDSGQVGATVFYVMPFVEGETLRARLARERQLPVDDAVRIAREVAAALDYAHRRGVIHRDIKPENILLHDGQALVADFGIALATSSAATGTRMTETGLSLGTPAYMSPEQASGDRLIDARSDIFALGCVLYEMLAGEAPFAGPSLQAVMTRVLTATPQSVAARRHTVPPHVDHAVSRALEKLPADRFASAAEFAAALNDPAFRTPTPSSLPAVRAVRDSRRVSAIVASLVAATLIAAALAAWGWLRPQPAPAVARFYVSFAGGESADPPLVSPDGRTFVRAGLTGMLARRSLDSLETTEIPDTYNAWSSFFSPDSASIAFMTGFPGDLRVVDLVTGQARTLVAGDAIGSGGAWSDDGWIYYTAERGGMTLMRVAAAGGAPAVVSRLDQNKDELFLRWPDALPGGKVLVATLWRKRGAPEIVAVDIGSGAVRVLRRGVRAFYLPTGHLVIVEGTGVVMASRFDAARGELSGTPVEVLRDVRVIYSGISHFSVSRSGTMLYSRRGADTQVVRVDRSGVAAVVDAAWKGAFTQNAVSPDGTRLAIGQTAEGRDEIWVKTLDDGPASRIAVAGSYSRRPSWSPDGRWVNFVSDVGGVIALFRAAADGSGSIEPVSAMSRPVDEGVWSRDGAWLFMRAGSGGGRDIFALKAGASGSPTPVVTGEADEYSPAPSPDGKWLAYGSTASGRDEVYVRAFPDASAGQWQISVDGGSEPAWAQSGRELFYRDRDGMLVAAALDTTTGPRVTGRQRLFSTTKFFADNRNRGYSVAPGDRSFYFVQSVQAAPTSDAVIVVLNWAEELKQVK